MTLGGRPGATRRRRPMPSKGVCEKRYATFRHPSHRRTRFDGNRHRLSSRHPVIGRPAFAGRSRLFLSGPFPSGALRGATPQGSADAASAWPPRSVGTDWPPRRRIAGLPVLPSSATPPPNAMPSTVPGSRSRNPYAGPVRTVGSKFHTPRSRPQQEMPRLRFLCYAGSVPGYEKAGRERHNRPRQMAGLHHPRAQARCSPL